MGRGIDQAQRLNADRGVSSRRIPKSQQAEEVVADMFGWSDVASIYNINRQAQTIINLAVGTKSRYEAASSNTAKYTYAQKFLAVYDFAVELAEESPVLEDGTLAEKYQELVFDQTTQGEYDVVDKLRPWSPDRPKALRDIPIFRDENIVKVGRWMQKNVAYEKMPEVTAPQKPRKARKPLRHPGTSAAPPVEDAVSTGDFYKGFPVKYRITSSFRALIADPDTSLYVLQDESLALAILKFSVDPNMSLGAARKVATTYLDRYPEERSFLLGQEHYANMRKRIQRGEKNAKLEQTLFFTNNAIMILAHDFKVKVGEHVLRELTGQLQRQMSRKFQLYRIEESLKTYFASASAEDFAKVLHAVTRSRFLMISYFKDDFDELKKKREGGWGVFKKFESVFLSDPFPTGGTKFLKDASPESRRIHALIRLGVNEAEFYRKQGSVPPSRGSFERAIEANERILSAFTELQTALSNYEKDKIKWGNRALAVLTLGLELVLTYFTAGLGARMKSLFRVFFDVAQSSLTQAFYRHIGLTDQSVAGIVKDVASGLVMDVVADNFAKRFVSESGIPLNSLKAKQLEMITSNFVSALQEEMLLRAMGSKSLDGFLKDLLLNFSTGIIHESVANKAVERSLARLAGQRPPLVTRHVVSQRYTPAGNNKAVHESAVELPVDGVNTRRAADNRLVKVDEKPVAETTPVATNRSFAKLDERFRLMHGTSPDDAQKIAETGFRFDPENDANSDLGAGVYMTSDEAVAHAAARRRTKGQAAILVFDLHASELGRIVDIRQGGAHYALWREHLNADAGLPKLPGWPMFTNAKILEYNVEKRADIFKAFLRKNGLEQADVVIGPLGDEFTTGTVMLVDARGGAKVSSQIVIRGQEVLARINGLIREAESTALPGRKGIENAGKENVSESITLNDFKEASEDDRELVSSRRAPKGMNKNGRKSAEPEESMGAKPEKGRQGTGTAKGNKVKRSRGTADQGTNRNGVASVVVVRKFTEAERNVMRRTRWHIQKHITVLLPHQVVEIRERQARIYTRFKRGKISPQQAIGQMTAVLDKAKEYSGVPALEAASLGYMANQRDAPEATRPNGVPIFDLNKLNNNPDEQIQEIIGEAKGGLSAKLSYSNRIYYDNDGLPRKGPVREADREVVLEGSGEWMFHRVMEIRKTDRARAQQIFNHIRNGRLRFLFTRSDGGGIVDGQDITDHVRANHPSITEFFGKEMYKTLFKGEI